MNLTKRTVPAYALTLLLAVMLFAFVLHCKGKADHLGEMADDPNLVSQNITKFASDQNLQFAFDFMGMEYHMKMMKLMKVNMKHVEGATHGLMVTIMENNTKKLVTDATVSLHIRRPDGSTISFDTEIMSGAGMHHYAVHLSADQDGDYLVEVNAKRRGREYKASTVFNP